ncbi:hypothetical protein FQA39_LY06417 [Lamprigera yunnana]|nr:hypothetical protein FQA39_LY06417 [Lamprigera yunnana]
MPEKQNQRRICPGSELLTSEQAVERMKSHENNRKPKPKPKPSKNTKKQQKQTCSFDSDGDLEQQITPTYIDTDDYTDLEDIINSPGENDLITCFQLTNESYQDYYERIRTKLECLLEQISINEDKEPLKNYKIQIFNKKALATYLLGLVEPYYSFMNYHTVNSLEECLLKLKDYDNHRQQANFMNFMRQKGQNKQNYKPINNYQKPQQFQPHQNNSPNLSPQNVSRQFNYNPQIPTNNQYKQNIFTRGRINIQNRPITTRYPTNNKVFGKKIESRPTSMSMSTRNTNANYRPNFPRQQNVFQSNGPRNFKSEELFNINECHNDSELIQDDFEDRLTSSSEDGLINESTSKEEVSETSAIIDGIEQFEIDEEVEWIVDKKLNLKGEFQKSLQNFQNGYLGKIIH